MKKGEICEGIVTRVAFPNKGIVTLEDGAQAVVKNVISGQKVSFAVQKVRKGRGEGRLLQVLSSSPLELPETICEHFGICGGCTYLSLPSEEQLKLKEQQVRELLSPVLAPCCEFDSVFEGIKASPRQLGYRNKMEFSFGDMEKGGPLTLGMHKRGSFHDIVTVGGCKIADEDFGRILACVLEYFKTRNTSYYHKLRHEGYLRHLLVRKAVKTGEILIDLITSSQVEGVVSKGTVPERGTPTSEQVLSDRESSKQEYDLLMGLVKELRELPLLGCIVGILHTKNDSVADAVIDQGTEILYGQDYFYEELLGLKFKISPFSFFQTNSLGAEVLYETAREYVADAGDGKVVYDLYSGTGTIAQLLAKVAHKVIGVELVTEAVEAARENAQRNGLSNCEFLAGDVLKVLDSIEDKPDFIVLDPPRDGVHPKALEKIIRFGVERMVYISCKPTSLARDLVVLQERGYRVERMCCVDMFPGTGNVETVVLLSQQKPDDTIEVDLDLDELDITSAETKATYREIQQYVMKQTGMMVSDLYIAQVRRKYGMDMRENYNLPKSENPRQPQCPTEKEKAIREALEHFNMI